MEVFVRSCRSAMGIAGDSLVGIFTADGDMVNGSCGTYLHAVIPPLIIKFILNSYRDNPGVKDGDLWFAVRLHAARRRTGSGLRVFG